MHTFCKPCLEHVLQQETLEAARKRRDLEQQRSSGYSSASSVSQYKGRWSRAFRNPDRSYETNRFSEDIIQCPICAKRTTLPMSGVHGLPDDQLAGKLASIVGKIPNYPVCEFCSSGHSGIYSDFPSTDGNTSRGNNHPSHRPWTDAEDGDTTSDVSTTEDEGEVLSEGGRQREDAIVKSRRITCGVHRRFNRNGQKKKTFNASDDEMFAPGLNQNPLEPNEAMAACLECGKRLCNFCLYNHTKVAVTADHVIVNLDQLTQMFCSRHPREMKRFFCLTCCELICLVCTFESSISNLNSDPDNDDDTQIKGHADHDVLSIRQGLRNLDQVIKKSIFDCRQKAERLELLLLGLKSCATSVNSIRNAIASFADKMINSILAQKEALLEGLDSDVGIPSEDLAFQCDVILSSLASWDAMKGKDDGTESAYALHPVDALREASLIRGRYNGVIDVLNASLPHHDNWPKLIKEIDNLEHNFTEQACLDNGSGSDTGNSEMDTATARTTNSFKVSKKVRFAPPAEAASLIPPSYNAHWARRLGSFIPGEGANLGRRATPGQLAAEAFANRQRFVSRAVQASPTDVHGKPLPAERGARRHRAIQIDLRMANLDDAIVQTDPCAIGTIQRIKVDFGTQYQSSDFNIPISFFRSSKQITVQK